ncbi:MAG: hypothetical protein ACQEUT_09605 [Bacillota bacterium]
MPSKSFYAIGVSIVLLLTPVTALSTSWAYSFVVWNEYVYVVTEEGVTDIEKEIGEVTAYSDMQQYPGNFSNEFSVGTKYFSITGFSTDEAIAVESHNGNYLKAVREMRYLEREPVEENRTLSLSILLVLIILLFAGLYISSRNLRSDF